MIRSTTSFLSAASTFPPSTTEPHGPGLSSFGPRSRVPRLPRRAGSIPPFAIFGRQVDGAVLTVCTITGLLLEAGWLLADRSGSPLGCSVQCSTRYEFMLPCTRADGRAQAREKRGE